jgi:hypothetical protein
MNYAPTIRFVVFDLLNDLQQIYDDSKLSPFKVFFWVMTFADRLRYQHVVKSDTGAFVYKFHVDVEVDSVTGRNFFTLPAAIYDLENDGGVQYITYPPEYDLSLPMFASTSFTRTSPEKAARLYYRSEECPSPSNPYFYRQNEKIWLLGCEEINLLHLEVGLKTSLAVADPLTDIDLPLDLPVHLLPVLKRQILDIGRFVLSIPVDRVNDGTSFDSKVMPTNKITSVNDIDQTQQNNE